MSAPRLRIGDLVVFTLGETRFAGTVIEDRGMLGVGGRQIVLVELEPDPDAGGEPRRIEMPAVELTLIHVAA